MYALMQDELTKENTTLPRTFLTMDGHMERLLQDIYGDEHEALLPKLVRVDIPYSGCGRESFHEKTYRIQRPEFINGLTSKMPTQCSVA